MEIVHFIQFVFGWGGSLLPLFLVCYIVFAGGATTFYRLLLHHVIQFNIYARKYKRHNCDERRTTINSKTVVISSHTLLS